MHPSHSSKVVWWGECRYRPTHFVVWFQEALLGYVSGLITVLYNYNYNPNITYHCILELPSIIPCVQAQMVRCIPITWWKCSIEGDPSAHITCYMAAGCIEWVSAGLEIILFNWKLTIPSCCTSESLNHNPEFQATKLERWTPLTGGLWRSIETTNSKYCLLRDRIILLFGSVCTHSVHSHKLIYIGDWSRSHQLSLVSGHDLP